MLDRLREKLGHSTAEDVESNPTLANSRPEGGADTDEGDSASTTGSGDTGEYVGRVAGQPEFDEDSGAEARAEEGEKN
ncbi:hypothetical protein [Pseudonocardia sp. KRD291]|uniref:hypothetical protein n=1 Tax=Pseudonocardia sp. KRD291 TaxID=2792007 RepID=UPI001C4A7177|nr:hypothetical protein [Pseudonocardia sp. KRD291]MBW0101150.1 hypothetical protein [Pseudonocardia sp. KRD291]